MNRTINLAVKPEENNQRVDTFIKNKEFNIKKKLKIK